MYDSEVQIGRLQWSPQACSISFCSWKMTTFNEFLYLILPMPNLWWCLHKSNLLVAITSGFISVSGGVGYSCGKQRSRHMFPPLSSISFCGRHCKSRNGSSGRNWGAGVPGQAGSVYAPSFSRNPPDLAS